MPALLKRRIVQVSTPVHSVSADDPFSRFGPLKRVDVRTLPKKNRLEELRKLRDLLKSESLDPKTIYDMMVFHPNLNLFEAVALAEREGKLLVPNIVQDRILTQTSAGYTGWTGTLVIYEVPNQSFKESVTFENINFQIPEEYRGRVNCALVIEYPDFTVVKIGENKYNVELTDGAVVHLVENFPKASGWYPQNELSIPYGNPESISPGLRYLSRSNSNHLGLLVRGDYGFYVRRNVILFVVQSDRLRVALIG